MEAEAEAEVEVGWLCEELGCGDCASASTSPSPPAPSVTPPTVTPPTVTPRLLEPRRPRGWPATTPPAEKTPPAFFPPAAALARPAMSLKASDTSCAVAPPSPWPRRSSKVSSSHDQPAAERAALISMHEIGIIMDEVGISIGEIGLGPSGACSASQPLR